jgi:hypothetical protein
LFNISLCSFITYFASASRIEFQPNSIDLYGTRVFHTFEVQRLVHMFFQEEAFFVFWSSKDAFRT